jgi:hypothetical protein
MRLPLGGGALLVLACAGPMPAEVAPAPAPSEVVEAVAPVDPTQIVLDRLERPWLAEAEAGGFGLHAVLGRHTGAAPSSLQAAWGDDPAYRALAEAWTASLTRTLEGVVDRDLVIEHADAANYPAGNVGRAFDVRWLRSPYAFFQLVGVVNRLDRLDFAEPGSCGEVRLVYRLAYRLTRADGAAQGSRLPFVVNVVLANPAGDCAAVARRWADQPDQPPRDWLARVLEGTRLQQVEVDIQAVRFPAGFETEFGGQAIYLLQVFALEGDRAVALPLENTPDVARLSTDTALKSELVAWISENLRSIDLGVYELPERFLAKEALSYSTLGINRRANKPFGTLFQGGEGRAALPEPEAGRFLGSRRALVERLDDGSCSGCHQAGSTAGFHLLGEEDPTLDGTVNQLQIGSSPHFLSERARRRDYVAAVADGRAPERFRPHSLSQAGAAPGYAAQANHPCVPDALAGELADGVAWGCQAPLVCEVLAKDETVALPFGQCVLPVERASELRAGMTCRSGIVRSRKLEPGLSPFNQHAYKDRLEITQLYGLPEDKTFSEEAFNCRPALLGVPLGRTYRSCTAQERTLTSVVGESVAPEMCAVVGGTRFDACAQGDFHACLEGIVGRGMIDTCHLGRLCREDYSCQRLPAGLPSMPPAARDVAEAGVGFCTPTYFLFQLRLDGHPVPVPD